MNENELDYLNEKIRIFFNFLESADSSYIISLKEAGLKEKANEEYEKRNIKWFRSMSKEIDHQYGRNPTLQQLFKEQFGEGIMVNDCKRQKRIASVLKRGVIKTRDEYELIEGHVDELCQSEDRNEDTDKQIDAFNMLLINPSSYSEV